MYFEFDLKIKGKGGPDDEVQFSKGVMSYYCNPDHSRIIFQLPSFQSTVKLVLQHVALPVAASLEVSVVNREPGDLVHLDGKITAGITRSYRHHMVLYDSSVRSGNLVGQNGSLLLNRKLVAVNGRAYEKGELLVLHVCFLDASCEIEDKDKMVPEEEDCEDHDEEEEEEEEEEEKEEEDPKNVLTLKFPQSESFWQHGCHKLKVKVEWTAVLDRPAGTNFLHRYSSTVPDGCSIDYRWGTLYE
uniref:Uncharacterized protein n=1 Tax=Avena sativa TaxID=4498 RepID=A0ACD5WTE8_AVESA